MKYRNFLNLKGNRKVTKKSDSIFITHSNFVEVASFCFHCFGIVGIAVIKYVTNLSLNDFVVKLTV